MELRKREEKKERKKKDMMSEIGCSIDSRVVESCVCSFGSFALEFK